MKKILGLSIAAVMLLGLLGIGTWAFFRDTEVMRTTLTAGTLDLKVDGQDGTTTFAMADLKPGGSGFGVSILNNAGSLPGTLSLTSSNLTNTENSPAEFNDGAPGDLGAQVSIAVYLDANQSGSFDTGDIGLKADGSTYSPSTTLQSATVDSYNNHSWSGLGTLLAGASKTFRVEWRFDESGSDQNVCQGDSLSIDFTFTLDQE